MHAAAVRTGQILLLASFIAVATALHAQLVVCCLQVVSGSLCMPTATVKLRGPDGIDRLATGMGTGPVDASFKAIDALVRVQVRRSDLTGQLLYTAAACAQPAAAVCAVQGASLRFAAAYAAAAQTRSQTRSQSGQQRLPENLLDCSACAALHSARQRLAMADCSLKEAARVQVRLVDYSLQSVTEGMDALATTRVSILPDGRMANEGFVTSYKVLLLLLLLLSVC